ncbi:MAG TPA: hypothetical protein VFF88_05490 [Methylocella sp.]|nr:hypothetical protein [Methylocella sp.]
MPANKGSPQRWLSFTCRASQWASLLLLAMGIFAHLSSGAALLFSEMPVSKQKSMLQGRPMGGASIGGLVTCRIINVGLGTVTIPSRQIIDNVNSSVPPLTGTCKVALTPGKNCFFTAKIGGNLAYSCRVIAAGTDVRLSGVGEIQSPAAAVLNAVLLQK